MNGTDRMRIGAVAAAQQMIADQDRALTAPIEAATFADLRAQLDTATDEQLAATAEHWEGRPGVRAAEYRLFVQAEITHRQATAALVAAMAPTTRWGVTR